MKYCFVCVCQTGELELQSLLLMASLKRHLQVEHELYVLIPSPESIWGKVSDETQRQLQAWGVKTFISDNAIDPNYPIANKLNCFNISTDAEKIIFLDSDTLLLNDFIDDPIFQQPLCLRAASLPLLEDDKDNWAQIYQTANLPMPKHQVTSTVSQQAMLPYYNAGFIAVDKALNFSKTWIHYCQLIDKNPQIQGKRPYLDQMALPLTAAALNIECTEVDKKYNYPPRLQDDPAVAEAIVYHYNNPEVILSTAPQVRALIQEFAELYPIIKSKVLQNSAWQVLLTSVEAAKGSVSYPLENLKSRFIDRYRNRLTPYIQAKRSNIIITGIPRSGSSLLSTLINQMDKAICLNEIRDDSNLFAMFNDLRQQIEQTQSVENKVDADNQLTTNTIANDTQVKKVAIDIEGKNFVLAQKFTLRYMVQLEKLLEDNWDVWAIVRHPVYTLLSWMRCPDNFPITQISPPNRWFHEVAFSSEDEDIRRIDIWNHFAEKLYQHRDKVNIIRYEDLIQNPQQTMQTFAKRYHLPMDMSKIQLDSKNQTARYSASDEIRIQKILSHARLDLFDYSDI